jgi:hypothetical protein
MDATTSAVLGTATTTTGGAFSGSVTIMSPSQMVHVVTSPSGYATSTTALTFFCGSNAVGNISPTLNANTTVSGTVFACFLANIGSGTAITITSGASTLWTGTTNSSGAYSASLAICGTQSITIAVTAPNARLNNNSLTISVTQGNTYAGQNVTLSPATGYACNARCKTVPMATSVTLTVTGNCDGFPWQSDTLTYTSSGPGYTGSVAGWLGSDITMASGPFGAGTYTYFMVASSGLIEAFLNHAGGGYIISSTGSTGTHTTCSIPIAGTFTCAVQTNITGSLSG